MTKSQTYSPGNWWLLVPAAGSVLFAVLYVVASFYYPGGSQADKAARGFSWLHNYWCNLLGEIGINGEPNAARQVAFAAMGVLGVTMASFAWLFPLYVPFSKRFRMVMQVAGVGAMVLAIFIFTNFHDLVINLASLLGLIGVAGTLIGLRMLNWRWLFWMGILNIFFVVLNNVLYYNKPWIIALPVVQKITFFSFLCWISMISLGLYRGKITRISV